MREEQARATIARIHRDYAGRIQATLDTHAVQPDGTGYRVNLLLIPGQRRAFAGEVSQVDDILSAWQAFLAGEEKN